jgi:transcription antitermination factor NusG
MAKAAPVVESEHCAGATVSKTVLKLSEPAIVNRLSNGRAVSQRAVGAMGRLAEIVAKLRSPAGGWPSDRPQTPETLAPYVTEEAYDAIVALQEEEKGKKAEREKRSTPQYILVEDLIPRLLWYMARSPREVMRLLEGVKARGLREGRWEAGGLRLVAILTAEAAGRSWAVDLATQQPVDCTEATVSCEVCEMIELEGGHSWKGTLKELAQRVRQQILAASPEVKILLERASVELLEPGNSWQLGEIELKFDFEFTAADGGVTGTPAPASDGPAAATPKSHSVSAAGETWVRLVSERVREQYLHSAVRQYLIGAVCQMQCEVSPSSGVGSEEIGFQESGGLLATIPSAHLIPSFVKAVWDLVEVRQEATASSGRLDELAHRLLWQIISSSYEVMQLAGGVKACVLQPERSWETGTVRLLGTLKVRAGDLNWDLDIAAGQVLPSGPYLLPAEAIIQSHACRHLREPARADNLLSRLRKQVRETAAFVGLLADGTSVECKAPGGEWRTGELQLSLDLQFIL